MRKFWVLSLKEILLTVRDIGALVMMLVTPLAITLVMAAAFGDGGDNPLEMIPVLLLNQDAGGMGQALVDIFYSDGVGNLVTPEVVADEATARARVDSDDVAALVIIPADFSARVFPLGALAQQLAGVDVTAMTSDTVLTPEQQLKLGMAFMHSRELAPAAPIIVEVYASPDWRISSAVVKSIVSQSLEILNIQIAGTANIIARLAAAQMQADTPSGDFAQMTGAFQTQLGGDGGQTTDLPVKLHITSSTGRRFSWLGYYASSLAVTFLMFAVTSGGRTLLAERQIGTLPRLLITPTPAPVILVGKMGGVILIGVLQLCVLWGATSLIGAYWGAPPSVLLAILIIVPCASSIGALISAWARSPGQAGAIGSAVTLVLSLIHI